MATPEERTLFAYTKKPAWMERGPWFGNVELTAVGWVYTPTGEVLVATDFDQATVDYWTAITTAAPAGTITFDPVTVTTTTADISFSYDANDALRFEYRVDGGTPVDLHLEKEFTVEGLTAGTTYLAGYVQVRAYNVTGNGIWYDVPEFTTNA